MKAVTYSFIFWLVASVSYGQARLTKIYMVKNGAQLLNGMQFYTTLDPEKVIRVKNTSYTVIEADVDSIGIISDNASLDSQERTIKPKPVFVKVEQGKSYFFKIGPAPASYRRQVEVDEMTERAFWLYIGLNELVDKPTSYVFTRSKNLEKVR